MADRPAPFREAKLLMISEVNELFDEYLTRAKNRDPEYQPNPMLLKAMEYTQRFATNKNRPTLVKIRELLASKLLTEEELALVANLSPSSAEEARKLVPSLDDRERFSDEDLDQMLQELATYREFE